MIAGKNRDLDFCVRIYSDIEDPSMAGEPGIRPAAVITNANRSDAIDDKKRFTHN
jgi:hypothetical protein